MLLCKTTLKQLLLFEMPPSKLSSFKTSSFKTSSLEWPLFERQLTLSKGIDLILPSFYTPLDENYFNYLSNE